VQLAELGAPMGYLDVGGGLGVDYDGSRTASAASTNYSLQNYANDVVATIKECCEPKAIAVPTLVSESGRAIASHFSILVFNVLGNTAVADQVPDQQPEEPLIVRNLRETLAGINPQNLQEAWNDARKFKDDALSSFRLGYLSLQHRGLAEQLYWACCWAITRELPSTDVPEDLRSLQAALAHTYYANLSIFRSAPDTWAIDQLFPVMPIHRLNEKPNQLGSFADLTCDSDGKLARFINSGSEKPLLELHSLKQGEPYWIGLFLAGAYQEVMGNLHNLFGSTNAVNIRLGAGSQYQVDHVVRGNTNAEVLKAMEHNPTTLLERLRQASEASISRGELSIAAASKLMEHLEQSLQQSTYLEADYQGEPIN
jgi:arginine decarboxylase